MARNTTIPKDQNKKNKKSGLDVKRIEKEIGSTGFNPDSFKFKPNSNNITILKAIGNCRYIENYIGIRINTDDKQSVYYKILVDDILKCFTEPLTVASVY